jgi:hypothetical protein
VGAMATVGTLLAILVLLLFVGLLSVCVWAIRHQNRMFPKGFDRTGWNPDGERAGWLMTRFTWLSGGRGGM